MAQEAFVFPVSFAQQRLWFLDQLEPESSFYNIPAAVRLAGLLNVTALEQSFNEIVRRHETLRTTFPAKDGQPVQVVASAMSVVLPVTDFSKCPESECEAQLQHLVTEEIRRPFDLARGPLFRISLFRLGEEEHVLLLNMHHIISDGWSMNVLFRELAALYQAFSTQQPSPLPKLPIQYADYAVWQRQWLTGEVLEGQLTYWKKQLGGALPVLELPTDRPRPAVQSHRGARRNVEMPKSLAEGLRGLSQREGVTLFMTLVAAFQTLLMRYTSQEDIIVGTGVANRDGAQTEDLIGFFVNTLVLRTDLSGDPTFREALGRVRELALEAYAHQDVPFNKLVEELQPERDLSRNPLFQVLFVQDVPQQGLELADLKLSPMEVDSNTVKVDLAVFMSEEAQGLRGAVEYSTDLFDAATITRMLSHFQVLLESIVADPDQRLSQLSLLTAQERHQLIVEWNQTHSHYPADRCLHHLFEEQAERTPTAVAVVLDEEQLTYRELNERANQLAHYLQERGIGAESLVGICLNRSIEMVVGLLGILKAGGAYVPLDPAYPPERLSFMLEDAAVSVLLTEESLLERLPAHTAEVCLDRDWQKIAQHRCENAENRAGAENLAYVIYTSGSTGRPKGVLVTHYNVVRLFQATDHWFNFDSRDVWTLFHSSAFDFSVWEMWGALLYGGRLVVVPYWVSRSPVAFYHLLLKEQVTVLNQTPSAFRQLMQAEQSVGQSVGEQAEELALRLVIFGGEALELQSLRSWFERHGEERPELVNMYGITETTVHVTYRPLRMEDVERCSGSVIGRPIPDLEVYILDKHGEVVPVGVGGEIHVGGAGLARGYLKREELSRERFIANRLSAEGGGRLYRTGDRGRHLADGEIEYLGRIDDQVKIRGFRIELGEIESVISQHSGVQESTVLIREYEPGDKRLVAYVVPDQQRAFTVRQLLRLQREGVLTDALTYELPNGMVIAHKNKSETDFLYKEIFEDLSYLRYGITLHEGDCIFDIGANIGLFTLFAGQRCKNSTLYAFEPIPPIFQMLRINTALYGLNVKLFDCGISSEAKTDTFTYYPHVSVISGRFADASEEREVVRTFLLNQQTSAGVTELSGEKLDELLAERLRSERFTCQLKTISDVIRENDVERIDLLKIDAEKSEMDVLAGIHGDDWQKIRQIVVEVHDIDGRLERITALLRGHGYQLTVEQDAMLKDTGLYNIYAVRPSEDRKLTSQVHGKPISETGPVWRSQQLLIGDMRRFLKERLPEYMLPSAFVLLETLPLTSNGKVDRKALPAPDQARPELGEAFVAPRTPVEEAVAGIWAKVLGVEQVGVYDNFFELGGHSLLATQAISRVREALQVELPLRSFFDSPVVADLAKSIEASRRSDENLQAPPLQPISRDGELPLSYAQHQLWFVEQLQPGSSSYSVPQAIRMSGTLDPEALRRALNAIVDRHESLRTTFASVDGEPVQAIGPRLEMELPLVDLSGLPENEREIQTLRLVDEEVQRPFDLARGPLFRASLLRLGDEEHVLLLNMHHIISDGWSLGVLFRELATLYEAFATGRPASLPELAIQYADYAYWQREWLQGEVLEKQLSYWRRRLNGAPALLKLPTDRPRLAVQSFRGARQFAVLPLSLAEELNALSQRESVTLFMTLLAAFQTLFYRYSHQDDMVVGTDVANRNRVETEGLIGFFINNVVMRTDLSGDPTFRELLGRVREVALEAYAHQDLPFSKLVEGLKPERSRGYHPLFQVLFVLQNAPMQKLELPGLTLSPVEVDSQTSKFDLAVFMEEKEQGLIGTWAYKTDLFDAATITRMAGHFATLLANVVAQPHARLSDLEMLTEAERRQKTVEKTERQESQLKKLKGARRRTVDLSQVSPIKADYLQPGETLPLVVEPNIEDLNLAEWAKSNREFIETKLLSHGAILFRGFNVDSVPEFERFALTICPDLFGEYGDLPREGVSGKVYGSTPYPSDQSILFHNESSHMHRWPMKIWFYCVKAAEQGGETPIVDIRKVYELLDPKIRERFMQKKLMYVRNYISGLDVSWQAFFRTTDKSVAEDYCRKVSMDFEWKNGDGLRTRQVCPAVVKHPKTGEMVFFNQVQLHHVSCLEPTVRESLLAMFREEDLPRNVYYGDGSPIEASVMQEIGEVYRKTTRSFPWQEEDILMLDNMLTAHGRNPYAGPRKIVVAMGEMMSKEDISH